MSKLTPPNDGTAVDTRELARHLRHLRASLGRVWAYDFGDHAQAKALVDPLLARIIDDLSATSSRPSCATVVFRPAPDGNRWVLGFEDDVRLLGFKYAGTRRAISAAYSAISGVEPVYAADHVRSGSRWPQNALRGTFARLVEEIDTRTGCTPLATAIESIKVSRSSGLVTYTPLPNLQILVGSVRTDFASPRPVC
jgi:hypothetical protein